MNSQQFKPELDECEYVAPDSPIIPLQSHSNDTQPIMVSTSPAKTVSDVWISNLNLYLKDLQILRSNGWLNDSNMCACQSIIRDFTKGKILGWQSPQCSKRKELLKPLPARTPFIQVLNLSGNH